MTFSSDCLFGVSIGSILIILNTLLLLSLLKISNKKCCKCEDFHRVDDNSLIDPHNIPRMVPIYKHDD